MRFGSCFSGIGGLDAGLESAGMTPAWQSEIEPLSCRVLAKHWPTVPNLGDITLIDWRTVEPVDVICGGYPCQPFSLAGNRGGDSDERHLWPFMLDAVRVLRPRYVLIENVAGHLSLGFDTVLADLAALGFDAEWSTLTACSVGAPHVRRRLFCVAYADGGRCSRVEESDIVSAAGVAASFGDDVDGQGLDRERSWNAGRPGSLGVADGIPGWVDRRRALGNSVVPQVAEIVGRRIMAVAA